MTSKIEWCDTTINPYPGCLHGCPYCYAGKMTRLYAKRWHVDPDFKPTWKEERLREFLKHQDDVIFVNSMGDLFGEWVDIRYIYQTMKMALSNKNAVMFLTKNPARYAEVVKAIGPDLPPTFWLGTTLDAGYKSSAPTVPDRLKAIAELDYPRKWISIEPYLPEHAEWYSPWLDNISMPKNWAGVQWVVFGVRTNPTTKLREHDLDALWKIWNMLRNQGKAIFVKDSIVSQMSGTRQLMAPREFPAGVRLATKSPGWKPKVKLP